MICSGKVNVGNQKGGQDFGINQKERKKVREGQKQTSEGGKN